MSEFSRIAYMKGDFHMVGSNALLSVSLSVTGPKFRLANNAYLRKYNSKCEYLLGAILQVASLQARVETDTHTHTDGAEDISIYR